MIIRVCLAAALLMPAGARAQGNPGPYGKLFGRAPAASAGQEQTTVEVRSSIGANYDSVLLAPEGSPSDAPEQSGVQGSGSAVLSVAHRTSAFTLNLSGGGGRGEYFTQPSSYGTTQYFANAQVRAKLSTRFDAEASAVYAHSPSYQFFSDFGRGPVGPTSTSDLGNALWPYSPYAAQMLENESLDANLGLTTQITKQSTLLLSAYQRQTRFAEQPDDDVVLSGYRATWQLQVRRGLGVHAGFGQEQFDVRGPERQDYDSALIDVGVDFNRSFSVARRTTLSFNTSTSVIKYDDTSNGEFFLNGGVNLSKNFRRTWQVSAQASRGTSFVPGFSEPLYADTVGASLGGMFSTRLEFMTAVTGARGESSFSNISGFGSVAATSRLTFALGKHVAAYGSYFAYWYDVPVNAFTLSVPGRMARQVVSGGLRFYVPVYEKKRQGQ